MLSFLPRAAATAAEPLPALLQRLARGDRGALEALYRQQAGPVYRYALALCSNAAWAADAWVPPLTSWSIASSCDVDSEYSGSSVPASVRTSGLLGWWGIEISNLLDWRPWWTPAVSTPPGACCPA